MGVDLTSALLKISRNNQKPGDFTDVEGYLVCGQCGGRKQVDIRIRDNTSYRVSCNCPCMEAAYKSEREAVEQRVFANKVRDLRKSGLTDAAYYGSTFENDDGKDVRNSKIARSYVDKWPQMRNEGMGLLLYGGVGTGKTFLACCIVNALIDLGVPAMVTSMPRILNRLQSMNYGEDRNDFIVSLQRYALLVIDDLGAERDTSYAHEQVYSVIDARYRTKKPMIVTTNLAPSDLKTPGNLELQRSYDRIKERCVPVKVDGESRRVAKMQSNRAAMAKILGIEM